MGVCRLGFALGHDFVLNGRRSVLYTGSFHPQAQQKLVKPWWGVPKRGRLNGHGIQHQLV